MQLLPFLQSPPSLSISAPLSCLSGSEMVEGGGGGGVLAGAPLPDCSPFTSHVSLQGLSLPPVCLSIFPSPPLLCEMFEG